jgi:hypothetical protein
LHLFRMINHYSPFGQVAKIEVLRANVATNVINDKVLG